ncbi:MAG: hypothetical protein AAGI52_01385 [Bacteroidota bacterium]
MTMLTFNGVRAHVRRAAAGLLSIFPLAAAAQSGTPAALSQDLHADQRAHLLRVGAWGAANVAGGLALVATAEEGSAQRAFGVQSAAWGAINTGIAAVGLLRGQGETAATWREAHGDENNYENVLLVNLGLNVGYAGVGTAMVLAAENGVDNADDWRGHGTALILQGAGLFVLDGIAYLGSRARLGALADIAEAATVTAGPGGVRVVVGL